MSLEFTKGKNWEFCGNGCRSRQNGPAMAQTLVCVNGWPINGAPSRSYFCPPCVTGMKAIWASALTDHDVDPLPAVAA